MKIPSFLHDQPRSYGQTASTFRMNRRVPRLNRRNFEILRVVAGNAVYRLLTCNPESWQTRFYPYLPDDFFLWTLFKFGAPIVRFSRVLDFPRRGEN